MQVVGHDSEGRCGLCGASPMEVVEVTLGTLLNGPLCTTCLLVIAQRNGTASTAARTPKARSKPSARATPAAPPSLLGPEEVSATDGVPAVSV